MSAAEERQAKALEGIAHYLKGLVPVLTAVNENLVEFAKLIKPKEGLNYEEMEERTAELLRNNPTSHQIPGEGE